MNTVKIPSRTGFSAVGKTKLSVELAKKLKDVPISEYKPNWNKQETPKQVIQIVTKDEPVKQEQIEDFEEITLDNF